MERISLAQQDTSRNVSESLRILHLKLKQLIASNDLNAAAAVGAQALDLMEDETSEALAEIAHIGTTLTSLGMVLPHNHRLRETMTRVLSSTSDKAPTPHVQSIMDNAIRAIRNLSLGDIDTFLGCVPTHASHSLFEALSAYIDTEIAIPVLLHPGFGLTVQRGLSSTPRGRAASIKLIGDIFLASPLELADRMLPLLTTAVLHERGALQECAVAALADGVYLLARSAPTFDTIERERALISLLGSAVVLLESLIHAPSLEVQRIAILGLMKVAVDPSCGADGTLLVECHDVESIVAELAFAFTQEMLR